MPPFSLFKSTKVVSASEIAAVTETGCWLNCDAPEYLVFRPFQPNMTARYTPVPLDYWIVYPDGYEAISPRQAFLEGYTAI